MPSKLFIQFYKAILVVMALSITGVAYGQGKWGTWHSIQFVNHLNKKLTFYLDGQIRSQKVFKYYSFYDMNVSVAYSILPKTEIQGGVGRLESLSPDGFFKAPELNAETRTWEQISFSHNAGILRLDHRYRIEQQFNIKGYHNRLRYRLSLYAPILKKDEINKVYLNTTAEIFLRDIDPFLNQYRIFMGAGFAVTKKLIIQAGWMGIAEQSAQHILIRKNFLHTSLITDLTFKKKE